jgi:GNAT superfamily N-acetyltransferase
MLRKATPADFDRLLELGRRMHAESWYAYLPFDEGKVYGVFEQLVTSPHGYAMVYERDGEILGGMLGIIAELWFCRELCATDLALFVEPDRRGGVVGARLVADFIAWADRAGVAEKSLAVSTGVLKEATGRLYEGMGLTHVGGIYKQRGAACATE